MFWLLIHLACAHVNGCTIEGKIYPTREECATAMTIPEYKTWGGHVIPTQLDGHSFCIPVSDSPIIPKEFDDKNPDN